MMDSNMGERSSLAGKKAMGSDEMCSEMVQQKVQDFSFCHNWNSIIMDKVRNIF